MNYEITNLSADGIKAERFDLLEIVAPLYQTETGRKSGSRGAASFLRNSDRSGSDVQCMKRNGSRSDKISKAALRAFIIIILLFFERRSVAVILPQPAFCTSTGLP